VSREQKGEKEKAAKGGGAEKGKYSKKKKKWPPPAAKNALEGFLKKRWGESLWGEMFPAGEKREIGSRELAPSG